MTNTKNLNQPIEGYLPTAVKYGFIGIVVINVASYIMYKLGMFTPGEDTLASILSLVLTVVPIALAIDAYRIEQLNGKISFNQAFGVGFMTTLVLAILGGIVFNFIFLDMLFPEVRDLLETEQINTMMNRGMTREAAVNALRSANDPVTGTIGYAVVCTIFGALSSLVLAAFMKRDRGGIV